MYFHNLANGVTDETHVESGSSLALTPAKGVGEGGTDLQPPAILVPGA